MLNVVTALKDVTAKGMDIPVELALATIEPILTEGKFFACISAAWELMLAPLPQTRRQRKADLDQLKSAIDQTCSGSFPANLFKLLGMWVEGKDIRSALG